MKFKRHTIIFKKRHFLFSKGNVFFIHGFDSNWTVHKNLLMDLYHEGYNIYTVDLPNHGLNIDFDRQFLFLDYIRFCKGYVNLKNKKKVILIGHSMGGGIVSAISHQIKNLKAVVLLDPLQKGAKAHKAKRLLASIFNKELHEKVKNWLAPKAANKNFDGKKLLSDLTSEASDKIINYGLSRIDVPLLVVFGENDYIIPPEPSVEHIKENAKKSPLIKVVLIKKAEHSPGVENEKETLKEITSFLLNI